MPELSIIVPVYKVEKFLPKCIDSILAQTYSNYELILVDDGSPDRCGAICDEHAAKDERIRVIHRENRGISAARNAGLDIAQGAFIGFVDSDDWIDPEMYETMIRIAKEMNTSIVVCGMNHYSEGGDYLRSTLCGSGIYSTFDSMKALFGAPNELGGGSCNKVYRRELIREIRFPESVSVAEDWLFLFECFKKCDAAVKISDCFYHVVERSDSATRLNEGKAYYDILFGGKAGKRLLKAARNYSPEVESLATGKYMDDCLRFSKVIKKNAKETHTPYRMKYARVRFQVIKLLPRAIIKKLLPKQQLHGIIHDLLED